MERIYNIPLRKEFQKAPNYKKAPKAMIALKEFLKKHMKSENIIIGKHLNDEIWKNGPRNPPPKVTVKVLKEEDKVKVELVDKFDETFKKEEPKKEKKKSIKEKIEDMKTPSPETREDEKLKEKVPSATELKEKKETKEKKEESKKVPKASELKSKKESSKE